MGNFRTGSLITGTLDNGYTITSRNSLMVVINEHPFSVAIISSKNEDYIGTEWIELNESLFEYTTFDAFFARMTDVPRPTIQKLTAIRRKYGIEKYITSDESAHQAEMQNAYQLSPEMRAELKAEMTTLLKQYRYHPTDAGLDKILDEWAKNKGWLIRLFEQHPNYNGKFQIVFDHDFDRKIDKHGSYNFADYLRTVRDSELFLKEVVIGDLSYPEVYSICRRLREITNFMSATKDIVTVNEKKFDEYTKEYNHYKEIQSTYKNNPNVYIDGNHAYDEKVISNRSYINRVIDLLEADGQITQFITTTAANHLNSYFPEAKIKEGQKLSRAINKVLTMIGVNLDDAYNSEFAKYADSINPLKIKRHTVLSIHPVDYYTMSFGNSWSSCHTIDRSNRRHAENGYHGMHSSGTESYMLDGTSMVFYTVDASYTGNELELQDKINRNMFHFFDDKLIQGRVYPQSNDSGANDLYKDIREIVQKIVSDLIKVPNLWVLKKGTSECSRVVNTTGTHYADYISFSNCNVSILKDSTSNSIIPIGHNPICPCCGKTHKTQDNIECNSCS